ncbi:MAG: hypothetical protein V1704_01355 [Candidatus Vogelbacteria bacterium]
MPAIWAAFIASATSARSASLMPKKPTKARFEIVSGVKIFSGSWFSARARTRKPDWDIRLKTDSNSAFSSFDKGWCLPSCQIFVAKLRITSGAPTTVRIFLSFRP